VLAADHFRSTPQAASASAEFPGSPGQWHGNGNAPSVMSAVSFDSDGKEDARVPLLIIGACAVGICAALLGRPVEGLCKALFVDVEGPHLR
jgi:hypothetical protein